MKVGVASLGDNIDSQIAPSFRLAKYIIVVEIENGEIKNVEVLNNPGRGILIANLLKSKGVKVAVAGHFGHGILENLSSVGIKPLALLGKVKDIISYLNEEKI